MWLCLFANSIYNKYSIQGFMDLLSESILSHVSWFTPLSIAPLPRLQLAFDKDFQSKCFGSVLEGWLLLQVWIYHHSLRHLLLQALSIHHCCYEMKKYGKRFSYILVEEYYFISLWQEREGTWPGSHMTLCHKA